MIPSAIQSIIQQKLSDHFGASSHQVQFQRIGGGSINDTWRIIRGTENYFCKINSAHKFPQLFEKEVEGLRLIGITHSIRVPGVIDHFESNGQQILLLEWITEGKRSSSFWKDFGQQLSALHGVQGTAFGLERDNYMGSVEQVNTYTPVWIDFFREQRLRTLVERCARLNLLSSSHVKKFEKLYQVLGSIFNESDGPVLVHGDLWSGNFMCDAESPVLIDPAVYYGHPSVDLGMTTLFGGFSAEFYEVYNYHRPFPSNYKEQWMICNLYPLLIHLLLFGQSYLSQIDQTLEKFYG
jgi:protein-ribulosamine 3-kinase